MVLSNSVVVRVIIWVKNHAICLAINSSPCALKSSKLVYCLSTALVKASRSLEAIEEELSCTAIDVCFFFRLRTRKHREVTREALRLSRIQRI